MLAREARGARVVRVAPKSKAAMAGMVAMAAMAKAGVLRARVKAAAMVGMDTRARVKGAGRV